MLIILFPPGGRTGNQLFQTAFIASLAGPKGYFFTRGFGKTRSYFYGTWKRRWINVDTKWLCWIIERLVEPFCWQVFVKTRVVSSIIESQGKRVQNRRGLFSHIMIVKGYFESDSFAKDYIHQAFILKPRYISNVKNILKAMPKGNIPIFIHIRHGDLKLVFLHGKNIQLPNSYYQKAIQTIQERIPNSFFYFIGDDPNFADSFFKDIKKKYVSRLSVPEDLALMSLCEGGILSNSTFSWWGAFLGKPNGYYIAPKYWSGWALKQWIPSGMNTEIVSKYLEVE